MLERQARNRLRDTIAAAIAMADDQQRHLIGALLAEALDALERDRRTTGD